MNNLVLTQDQLLDMAFAILRATDDGNKLAASDLKLVQLAANNLLDLNGMALLQQLHANATKPEGYTTPFLFGIKHLTMDPRGLVRWRGAVVDHFDHAVWKSAKWRERMWLDATSLAARCRELEAQGIRPTAANVANNR